MGEEYRVRSIRAEQREAPPRNSSPLCKPAPGGSENKEYSLGERSEEQGSVGATEPEGVAHSGADIDLARGIRDVVQVTLRIGILIVYGGRQHPMAQR